MSIVDSLDPWFRSVVESVARPPFWKAGTCPMVDSSGNVYDWGSICKPGWALTGAIVDESVEVGTKVVGQGILIALNVVLTSARAVQRRNLADLKFYAPVALNGRPRIAKVVAVGRPRSDVDYQDPADLEVLVRQESSDIALLRLEATPAGTESPSVYVGLGAAPTRAQVQYILAHPNERCGVRADCIPGHPELRCQPPASCEKSFADAVLFSFYRDSPEFNFVTPVQWVDVSENGSVLVAWNNHHPGDTTPLVPGVSYGPAMDRGAPVVAVGASVRPKVVGVVSGWLDVPEKGVIYRITRTDTWAPWVVAQIQSWFGPRYPTPDVPPAPGRPPVEHYRGVLRRKGSLTAAAAALVFGGGGILVAAR